MTALAALPFFGRFAAAAPAKRPIVEAVRELLLPHLHMQGCDHPDIDLAIDVVGDHLLVKGYSRANKIALAFAITPLDIKDRRYLTTFKPALAHLIKLLEDPTTPEKMKDRMWSSLGALSS